MVVSGCNNSSNSRSMIRGSAISNSKRRIQQDEPQREHDESSTGPALHLAFCSPKNRMLSCWIVLVVVISCVSCPVQAWSPMLRTSTTATTRRVVVALAAAASSEEDDEDDDMIVDADSLGDWRAFRQRLASNDKVVEKETSENADVLETQNSKLAKEYETVWAHETAVPELGGLLLRLPLEVELHRNYEYKTATGGRLRNQWGPLPLSEFYGRAQTFVQKEMLDIASRAGPDGQLDATQLSGSAAELLGLYLDHQENWQEVCLVVSREESKSLTYVLNRPMAFQLTENMAQMVLFGADDGSVELLGRSAVGRQNKQLLTQFMLAFGTECAVYIGGPDDQHLPADVVHGYADLEGAVEIAPGLYRGGLDDAIQGVLRGKYRPTDFRFFIGRHVYPATTLDVSVVLGKYQPVAAARCLALKQCLSLPQPLWHEVLELCGGAMKEISQLESQKREAVQFQIIDDDDDSDDSINELGALDDDEDGDYL